MKYFLVYYAIGLVWLAFNFASAPELMTRLFQRAWEDADGSWKFWAGMTVGPLIWPWNIVVSILHRTSLGHWYLGKVRNIIRRTLDRPGLLEPQMPAPRCSIHDLALDIEEARCSLCNGQLHFFFCVACRTQMNAQGYVPPPAGIVCLECEGTRPKPVSIEKSR